ncbi:integrase [Glaciihabitans sp. UYNi722]
MKFHRQFHTKKGPGGAREVILPEWILPTIRQRLEYSVDNPDGLLFATRNHTLLSPHNVRESWRNVRDAASLGWVSPHNLRKTALSEIDAVFGIEAASGFANHTSTSVTTRHYVGKKVAPAFDARAPWTGSRPRRCCGLLRTNRPLLRPFLIRI